MHLMRLWMVPALFAACAAGAAVVYKWTDADGVVHFSDQSAPGAEKIVTAAPASNNGVGAGAPAAPGYPAPGQQHGSNGDSVPSIESPAKEQVFFNDDVVPVRLHIEAGLQAGQTVSWELNGKKLDQGPTTLSFALQSLPRGAYVISATITDPATGGSQSAEGVTFYVRQPSDLAPQHKKS